MFQHSGERCSFTDRFHLNHLAQRRQRLTPSKGPTHYPDVGSPHSRLRRYAPPDAERFYAGAPAGAKAAVEFCTRVRSPDRRVRSCCSSPPGRRDAAASVERRRARRRRWSFRRASITGPPGSQPPQLLPGRPGRGGFCRAPAVPKAAVKFCSRASTAGPAGLALPQLLQDARTRGGQSRQARRRRSASGTDVAPALPCLLDSRTRTDAMRKLFKRFAS